MFKNEEIENYFNFMDDDIWLRWEQKNDFYLLSYYLS